MVVDAEGYGVLPTNTAADNDAGMAALFAAHLAGVTVGFPQAGIYRFAQPFPWRSNLSMIGGAGLNTRLSMSGSLFKPSATAGLAGGIRIDHIAIDNAGTGHLIDLDAGADAINFHVTDAELDVTGVGNSIISAGGNSTNLFGFRFHRALLSRAKECAAPGIFLVSDSVGLNDWAFRDCQWHSHLSTKPFFFACYSGDINGICNFVFDGILSEQAQSGAISLQGVQGTTINALCDYDTTHYAASLVRIAKGTHPTTPIPSNRSQVTNVGSGTHNADFPGGSYHVKIIDGVGHAVARIYAGDVAGTQSIT